MDNVTKTELKPSPDGHDLQQRIEQKVASIAAVADELPSVVIIHNVQRGMAVEYMSERGHQMLGVTLNDIRNMGPEYYNRFFNPDDAQDHVKKFTHLIEHENNDEIISLFQQVRASEDMPWSWYLTTLKILMRDDHGQPLLTLGLASPIDTLHSLTAKVSRLLDENTFLRNNYSRYSKLSDREREVLMHLALAKTASESAEELCISTTTVETHRRNIKKKLETSSFYDLSQYARAFDLI